MRQGPGHAGGPGRDGGTSPACCGASGDLDVVREPNFGPARGYTDPVFPFAGSAMPVTCLFEYFPCRLAPLGAAHLLEQGKPLFAPVVKTGRSNAILPPTGQMPRGEGRSDSTHPQFRQPAPDAISLTPSAPFGQAGVTAEAIGTPGMVPENGKPAEVEVAVAESDAQADLPVSIQPEVPGSGRASEIRALDLKISQAIEKKDPASLALLLDTHPHAGRDPADKSASACIRQFFRVIASWFDSDAFAWQGTQAVVLLEEAARAGNEESIRLLLERGMDLGKDKQMLEPALRIAVEKGNAEAVRLLLSGILQDDPQYAKYSELVDRAARGQKAGVLEVLVENSMALPAQKRWKHYSEPIRDYLRWKATGNAGTCDLASLSCTAQRALSAAIREAHQFRSQLNGIKRRLNSAQNNFLLAGIAGMVAASGLYKVQRETYTDAGFSQSTAELLASHLDLNAEAYIDGLKNNAMAKLATAVTAEFDRFLAGGEIRPDLLTFLLNNGMYAHAAFLVVTAFEEVRQDPAWQGSSDHDRPLLAKALVQSTIDQAPLVEQAAQLSGDAALFHSLLDLQLLLLCRSCSTQRAARSAEVPGQALGGSHP